MALSPFHEVGHEVALAACARRVGQGHLRFWASLEPSTPTRTGPEAPERAGRRFWANIVRATRAKPAQRRAPSEVRDERVRDCDRVAQRNQVASVELVRRNAQTLPSDAPLEVDREQSVVAADEHMRFDVRPGL